MSTSISETILRDVGKDVRALLNSPHEKMFPDKVVRHRALQAVGIVLALAIGLLSWLQSSKPPATNHHAPLRCVRPKIKIIPVSFCEGVYSSGIVSRSSESVIQFDATSFENSRSSLANSCSA